jgi:antitoxin component of MazEF toxin-antitoxin module
METKVIRRDGETAVGSPNELAIATGGDLVISRSEDDLSLDELLDRVTEENKHELLDWGAPVGKEVW